MEKFKLVVPSMEHESQAIDFINEHHQYDSNATHIAGGASIDKFVDDYPGWLQKLENDRNQIPNEQRVPAKTFFLVRTNDERIVGMISIRLELNEHLRNYGGHIGYEIRPTERRKGYNRINLFLALCECQKNNIEKVMLSCDKKNIASSKTMIGLGGVFEREFYYEDEEDLTQIYWIDVNEAITNNTERFKPYI